MTLQPNLQCMVERGAHPDAQQQQQQQQEDEAASCSRPATAELRALLASSHSKDGIAERLEYYR
jgi:hypothetical protein